jgi:hypothetical protein
MQGVNHVRAIIYDAGLSQVSCLPNECLTYHRNNIQRRIASDFSFSLRTTDYKIIVATILDFTDS